MECVIYARISLDRTGEGLGVARQEQECRALAKQLDMTVTHVYTDNDISATSGKVRPAFEDMLAARPPAIITWHQDRLLRLTRDLERVIELNVPVYTVTAGTLDLTTPAGRAVARTVAAWSQYEGEQKATRQVAANRQRAAKGAPAPSVGYGYQRGPGGLEVVDKEAAVIREVTARLLDGESLRSIAADLNRRGVESPRRTAGAGLWSGTTLRQMILRESLAGLRRYRGQVIGEGDWPPIISRDEHERIVAMLNDPSRKGQYTGRAPVHLLSGLAICGKCGGKMKRFPGRMTKTKSGAKRQPASYACVECYGVRRKQSDVDAVVEGNLVGRGTVLGRLQMPDAAGLFTRGNPAAVQDARDSIEAIDARLANAADMYATGDIDAAQLARITERLRADRAAATATMEAALPAAVPADLIGPNARQVWDGLSMDTKRAVLAELVTVTILPSGSGKDFDPDTVRVDWITPA
ncbi:recombinase family protein [Microbacterium sp. NPDC096154]|uniref:recombinase family protein n=1 Tax=Microbacterium sp. NPDC096154 TaxID=3155549 RepID=UPI003317BA1D